MYCNHCGKKNSKGAKFCQSCGKAIGKSTFEEVAENVDESTEVNEEKEVESPKSYLANKIKEKSLRRLYFGFALVGLSIIILLSQANYIANILSGPRTLSPDALESEILSGNINDINVALQLPSDGVYPAGYTHITQTINENTNQVESQVTDGAYYLTLVGRHILVLEGNTNQTPSGNFNGVLIPLPTDLQNKLVADFNNDPKLSGLSGDFLAYELSDKGILSLDQIWVVLLGLGILAWGGFIVLRRINDKEDKNHYIYKIAGSAGYHSIKDFSEDFIKSKDEKFIELGGGYYLNHKFLFNDGYFSFHVFPLSQLFWMYKSIVKRSVNFIPTGKHHELSMHFRPNIKVSIKEDEATVNQNLYILANLCPAAKLGYR